MAHECAVRSSTDGARSAPDCLAFVTSARQVTDTIDVNGQAGFVVVLDDDASVAATIGLIAESAGFRVVVTHRIGEFERALDEVTPTHVTIDLNMPEVDGIEVLRRLAERKFAGSVIISSGLERRVLEAAERSAVEHGLRIAGALPKPFRADDLRRLLASAVVPSEPRGGGAAGVVDAVALRAALSAGAIVVAYQPKIACASREVVGFEALARWSDPDLGNVPPDVFIPLAEREGLIDELTDQVFDRALRWLSQVDPHGAWHIALNLSARSLGDLGLTDRIERACARYRVAPDRVILELTETASSEGADATTALDVLTRFRIKGLALSIDDFGTGHSTLVQLARQPFNELKIDRQFVMRAAHSEESRIIIRAMVGLAHGLGLRATAEGVEDADTLRFLADVRCDRAQGYHIARPLAPDAVTTWIAGWHGGGA